MSRKYMVPRAEKITLYTEGIIADSGSSIKISADKKIENSNDNLSAGKDESSL